jgi:hypothetical protein
VKVELFFKGSVTFDVDADPDDAEAWCEAVGTAWALLPDEEIAEAAQPYYEEIVAAHFAERLKDVPCLLEETDGSRGSA